MGIWDQNQYIIKQKVLTIGRKYFIYDSKNQMVGFCKQKLFKLKEDIRIYTDESMKKELLCIKQQNILDWSGTFAVQDSTQNYAVIGFVGRKALTSIFRDTWKIFDHDNKEIATVLEEGGALAVMRRFIGFLKFVPKTYTFENSKGTVAEAKQKFQIIGDTWNLSTFSNNDVDIRLIVTAALMMDIVEQSKGA